MTAMLLPPLKRCWTKSTICKTSYPWLSQRWAGDIPVDGSRAANGNEMRHRRGIDLTGGNNDNMPPKPTGIFVPQRDHSATLADLPQWYVVGAQRGTGHEL